MDKLCKDPIIMQKSRSDILKILEDIFVTDLKVRKDEIYAYIIKKLENANEEVEYNVLYLYIFHDIIVHFKVEADFEDTTSTNYEEHINSIFITLKENIENGLTFNEIKDAILTGMDDLGYKVGGISKIIDKFVQLKKEDIIAIRENYKKWESR